METQPLRRSPTSSPSEDEDSDEGLPSGYHQVSIQVCRCTFCCRFVSKAKYKLLFILQLLDLMHTLHTRTAQIFKWWAEEGGEITQEVSLWTQGWCPLLQGIARLCCDTRRQVKQQIQFKYCY